MKNPRSELSKIFLEKLEELDAAHNGQMQSLMTAHEAHLQRQQEFFERQQKLSENKVTELLTRIQDLETHVLALSKSLEPLSEQLKLVATLSDTLRNT